MRRGVGIGLVVVGLVVIGFQEVRAQEAEACKGIIVNYGNFGEGDLNSDGKVNLADWVECWLGSPTPTGIGSQSAVELVKNGNFSLDGQYWSLGYQVRQEDCGAGHGNCVSLPYQDAASRDIKQDIENAAGGTIRFWAKNPTALTTFEVQVEIHERNNTINHCYNWQSGTRAIPPGTGWYEITLPIPNWSSTPCPPGGTFRIMRTDNWGGATSRLYIDDVSVVGEVITPSPAVTFTPTPTPAACDPALCKSPSACFPIENWRREPCARADYVCCYPPSPTPTFPPGNYTWSSCAGSGSVGTIECPPGQAYAWGSSCEPGFSWWCYWPDCRQGTIGACGGEAVSADKSPVWPCRCVKN